MTQTVFDLLDKQGEVFKTMPNRYDLKIYEKATKSFYESNNPAKRLPHVLFGKLYVSWINSNTENRIIAGVCAEPLENLTLAGIKTHVAKGDVVLNIVDNETETPDIPDREVMGMLLKEGMSVIRNDIDEKKRLAEVKRFALNEIGKHQDSTYKAELKKENDSLKAQLEALKAKQEGKKNG